MSFSSSFNFWPFFLAFKSSMWLHSIHLSFPSSWPGLGARQRSAPDAEKVRLLPFLTISSGSPEKQANFWLDILFSSGLLVLLMQARRTFIFGCLSLLFLLPSAPNFFCLPIASFKTYWGTPQTGRHLGSLGPIYTPVIMRSTWGSLPVYLPSSWTGSDSWGFSENLRNFSWK